MKINHLILLVLTTFFSCKKEEVQQSEVCPEQGQTKHLLVIGNSYSRANKMLQKLERMALSTGDSIIIDSGVLYAGARIINHAASNNVKDKINSKSWDFVSLQTHSQESALSQAYIDTAVFPSISSLVGLIKENRATPLYFRTWGYQEGDSDLCDSLPNLCAYEIMDSVIHDRYSYYAEELGGELAPVGDVWKYFRTNHPEIALYVEDGSHPTAIASYINACVFYTMILKKSPLEITYNYYTEDTTEEELVKQVVDALVFQNLESLHFEGKR